MKKRLFCISVICILMFSCCLIVEAQPANPAFVDDNFYHCVIDAYNEQNSYSLGYDVNLTEEDLNRINNLECNDVNKAETFRIHSVKGLEQLRNLTKLDLSYNLFTEIDLSDNLYLNSLYIHDTPLETIKLNHNKNLNKLSINTTNLSDVDISDNINLTELYLSWNNNLKYIDVSKNINLTQITIHSSALEDIDVSKNVQLKRLYIHGNQNLLNLDVSDNVNLERLEIFSNNISNIDLTNNPKLSSLSIGHNKLSNIDLSKNVKLSSISIFDNNLSELDLTNNPLVKYLICDPISVIISKPLMFENEKYVVDLNSIYFLNKDYNVNPLEIAPSNDYIYDAENNKIYIDDINIFSGNIMVKSLKEDGYPFTIKLIFSSEEQSAKNKETIVKVPDTKLDKSHFVLLISCFFILAGIGIFYIQLGKKKQG